MARRAQGDIWFWNKQSQAIDRPMYLHTFSRQRPTVFPIAALLDSEGKFNCGNLIG
jgi:hypothetical protein